MELEVAVPGCTLRGDVAGDGPRLVWLHGIGGHRGSDHEIVRALRASSTVCAYDARGHGASHATEGFTYPRLADDLVAVLDALSWERAIVAGSSMGAATAGRLACLHPQRVEALIAVRPGADGGDGRAPEWLRTVFAAGAAALRSGGLEGGLAFLRALPQADGVLDGDREAMLRAQWAAHDVASIAAALEQIPQTAPLGGLDLGAVRVPVLVIGGADPVHPPEAARAIAAAVPGAVLTDPVPDAVSIAASIASFLAERAIASR